MKPFIGLSKLWYHDPLTTAISSAADVTALIQGGTEVKNVHEGTWGYSQDDPTITDYINELTGRPYFRDPETDGTKVINFSIGSYDYATKAALAGGTTITSGTGSSTTTIGWKPATEPAIIEKAIIALTKTGQYIIFSNASIVAKVDPQQKNLTLGVTATAQESTHDDVLPEYWIDKPTTA